jgi:uncharacterized membrane protein
MPPISSSGSGTEDNSKKPSASPESGVVHRPWPGLDRLGLLQVFGGLNLGLVALFSSYDHISLDGYTFHLQQQWGIACIAASLAIVVVDAQLATRARDRGAHQANRDRDLASEERQRADQEREDQIRKDSELIRRDRERIRKETELLKLENARMKELNSRMDNLLSCVDQLCFPPESSSSLPPSTDSD